MVLAVGLSCWLVLGKCWSRTGGPRSGTVVLVGFREVLEQDWWSSQWDCRVGWF